MVNKSLTFVLLLCFALFAVIVAIGAQQTGNAREHDQAAQPGFIGKIKNMVRKVVGGSEEKVSTGSIPVESGDYESPTTEAMARDHIVRPAHVDEFVAGDLADSLARSTFTPEYLTPARPGEADLTLGEKIKQQMTKDMVTEPFTHAAQEVKETASNIKEKMYDVAQGAMDRASNIPEVLDTAKQQAGELLQETGDILHSARQKAGNVMEGTKDATGTIFNKAAYVAQEAKERVQSGAKEAASEVKDKAGTVTSKLGGAAEFVKEKAHGMAESIGNIAHNLAERAQQVPEWEQSWEQHPVGQQEAARATSDLSGESAPNLAAHSRIGSSKVRADLNQQQKLREASDLLGEQVGTLSTEQQQFARQMGDIPEWERAYHASQQQQNIGLEVPQTNAGLTDTANVGVPM